MENKYRKTPHTVYEIKYHFIWCPKYRYAVLEGELKSWLEKTISKICESMEIIVVEGHIREGSHSSVCECVTEILTY
jgi:putative transposase